MKTFENLFAELQDKLSRQDPNSRTVKEYNLGTHAIGKKIVEEAAEVWMAAEYEGNERTAEEISQLLYHLQVLMLRQNISLAEIYEKL
ncbi:MAG: phosphoribosyl-ATP diphosphatase [Oligosphaeraceae bacterium]|nr:phosphoribosyl-ATP diphosphatase [Oligosphaeraceae bacterium]